MGLLDGRTALVTGGSRGLGRAICLTLAREGANVAFNYSRSTEEAEEVKQAILAQGVKAWAFQVSVLDKAGLQQMVRTLELDAGHIDILVNNAGVGQVVPLALMEEEDWDRLMNINVKGAFLTTQAVLRGMIHQKRGRIPQHRLAGRGENDAGPGPLQRRQGRAQGHDRSAGQGSRALRHYCELPRAGRAERRRGRQPARQQTGRIPAPLRAGAAGDGGRSGGGGGVFCVGPE